MIISSLLNSLNDGDKANRTALLPVDGSTGAPLKKGHNLQANRLFRYTAHPSGISNPYFQAHAQLITPYTDEELNKRLEHFRSTQGAGLALVDPLQTPDKVAIGFFARSSPAMILRHYIAAANKSMLAKEYPPILLMWDSAIHPPASEWDAFANIKPASALVAYSHPDNIVHATTGLRFLYSDPTATPPLGRQMFFCPMLEFWGQPVHFIGQVLDQHLNSMMCEDVTTEVHGLRTLDSPFPNANSTSTLRDLFLAARTDPDVPDSLYLFTSVEQSGLQTRFLFYEEVSQPAREFVQTLEASVKQQFDIEDMSNLFLPNSGPSETESSLTADFTNLQHLFPTTAMTQNSGLLTNSSSEPSSYMQSLLEGHASGAPSRHQQRRPESNTLARRGRRS